jgi:hypothetical protein
VATVAAESAKKASIVLRITNLLHENKRDVIDTGSQPDQAGIVPMVRLGALRRRRSACFDTKEEVSSGAITFS